MDYSNVIIAVCSVITTLLALKFWILSPIEKRFDKVDEQILGIRKDIQGLESRVSHIEGYLMGRSWKDGTGL